jgi:hypothetical protein
MLTGWSTDQQDIGPDVCSLCDLPRPFTKPTGRQCIQHRQGELRRAAHEDVTRVRSPFPPSPVPPLIYTTSYSGEEALQAFEELFLYACPKFITANPPPYDDAEALQAYIEKPPTEPSARHLSHFLSDVRAQQAVPTLRSFLKLYTSLDAAKLAG